uniref:Uncharacterized protein n=1 Tax=candidate division WOR-3 bacterium TaxID=2052148 RepID=A0A7V3ZYZ1_UNCW3
MSVRDFFIKLSKIDRKYIYLIILIGLIIPLVFPPNFPQKMSPQVKRVFEFIDTLPKGSYVILSADYDPSVAPEVHPMYKAVVKHCILRGIIPIGMTLGVQGAGLAVEAFTEAERVLGARRDTDYVFLGYQAGGAVVILGLGEDIKGVYKTDYFGTKTTEIYALKPVKNYKDIALVISFSGSSIPVTWAVYAYTKYGVKVAAAVTGVSAGDFYPYIQAGQFIGMLAGMKAAAEYEYAVNQILKERNIREKPSTDAIRMMDANSIGQLLIILFIIIGNIGYFLSRRRK